MIARVFAIVAVAAAILAAAPVDARQAPRPGCTAVSKKEYDTARNSRRLESRFGSYLRTGPVMRRKYWYCTG